MIRALALLLTCQLAGETLMRALGLAVPGPVIGLGLLAVLAVVHARIAGAEISAIEKTDPKLRAELSNELHVTPQTPPTFLFSRVSCRSASTAATLPCTIARALRPA